MQIVIFCGLTACALSMSVHHNHIIQIIQLRKTDIYYKAQLVYNMTPDYVFSVCYHTFTS